jgi:hypothetical protein
MALERNNDRGSTPTGVDLRDDDRFIGYEAENERSHFGAFLMGGIVVAGGLLAFLYYDTDNLNGRTYNELTTGSTSQSGAPKALPSLRLSPAPHNRADKQ